MPSVQGRLFDTHRQATLDHLQLGVAPHTLIQLQLLQLQVQLSVPDLAHRRIQFAAEVCHTPILVRQTGLQLGEARFQLLHFPIAFQERLCEYAHVDGLGTRAGCREYLLHLSNDTCTVLLQDPHQVLDWDHAGGQLCPRQLACAIGLLGAPPSRPPAIRRRRPRGHHGHQRRGGLGSRRRLRGQRLLRRRRGRRCCCGEGRRDGGVALDGVQDVGQLLGSALVEQRRDLIDDRGLIRAGDHGCHRPNACCPAVLLSK
mmetsp:Transcript_80717/g.218839  ORF Transcript_80717/g.218839 Transcript_80717/m.218839 type:complete len:258 (+) Transcript_80717:320-1093(+)